MIKIKKGLDLPISGEPRQEIGACPSVRSVAVIGDDFVGMRPSMAVKEGDEVKVGQELFSDKKNPGVIYTSPACGKIKAIHRGDRRALQAIVIELGGKDFIEFKSYEKSALDGLSAEEVRQNLVNSGLWSAFRTRPFSLVPAVDAHPSSIFVNFMDTNPLAAYPGAVLDKEFDEEIQIGLDLLSKLTNGNVHVCKDPYTHLPNISNTKVKVSTFSGVHPAGLVGTHIHFLDPVHDKKSVWHLSYQDLVRIAKLFITGRIWTETIISLAGPAVTQPRLLRVPLGSNIDDICSDQLKEGLNVRKISGSVLTGRAATGPYAYLGRYHLQVCVLEEGTQREFLGWQMPGFDKFSVKNAFFSALFPWGRKFPMTTSTGGSVRAMVPVGSYEKIMPLDLEPTFFLRSLLSADWEQAVALGALELDEEDLGLCTFVCPGKVEYGPLLRDVLSTIIKEG